MTDLEHEIEQDRRQTYVCLPSGNVYYFSGMFAQMPTEEDEMEARKVKP